MSEPHPPSQVLPPSDGEGVAAPKYLRAQERRAATIEASRSLIEALAGATLTQDTAERVDNPHEHFRLAAVFVLPGMRGVVPGVIDPVKERERLTRQPSRWPARSRC